MYKLTLVFRGLRFFLRSPSPFLQERNNGGYVINDFLVELEEELRQPSLVHSMVGGPSLMAETEKESNAMLFPSYNGGHHGNGG